jgi:hypothetical protein
MIKEDIFKKFQNIQQLPTVEEIDIFDEKILTEVEFKLTRELVEKWPINAEEHWSRLKRRWLERWG